MSRQASAEKMIDNLIADIHALEERIEDLEADRERLRELESRVDTIDERTDMLRLIEEADQLDADQRRAALWQHAIREAKQSSTSSVVMDRDDVERALHYPDVHRTTLYEDMRQVADNVAVAGVAEYVSADRSETDTTELRVDLSGLDEAVDPSTLYEGGD